MIFRLAYSLISVVFVSSAFSVSLSLDCKNEQNRVKWAGVNGLGLSTAKGMTEFWM